MKKSRLKAMIILCLFACFLILMFSQITYGEGSQKPSLYSNRALVDAAYKVLESIKDQDYVSLSQAVHPEKGVTFTPYSYISDDDMRFSAEEIIQIETDGPSYEWGQYDGSGEPIIRTCREYFARFVYNADYIDAPVIGVNHIVHTGNSIENVTDIYPEAQFVEFHFPGVDPEYEGMDWCTLKLVFEQYGGSLTLVAVIHSEWTI